jgi:hypothetical protein
VANYLEQLVSEWYEFQGYFVRKNILVGKRKKGGYECELDVVAFHPEKFHLTHIEPSMDASSWELRKKRYEKKFKAGKKYIPGMFAGMNIPVNIDQIALFGFMGKKHRQFLSGGKVITIAELLRDICDNTKSYRTATNIIPEQYPLLRTIMFMTEHRKDIFQDK